MKKIIITLFIAISFVFSMGQGTSRTDARTEEILSKLEVDTIAKYIKHLENYVSRCYTNPEGLLASQQWIHDTYQRYSDEYEVYLQPITLPSYINSYTPYPSDEIIENASNVFVIKRGVVDPDKYMIVGGHFDSFNNKIMTNFSFDGPAPGADDNASGTAAVMEMARVMVDYKTDYSIIFCAWNLEEIGLWGSKEFVKDAKEKKMDIIGYINLDMIGYVPQDNDFTTSVDYNGNSKGLYERFKELAAIYTPDLVVQKMNVGSGGGSDHASFHAVQYKAIFPFEKGGEYSPVQTPFYHSENDVFDKSINSMDFAMMLTKSSLATVVDLSTEQPNSVFNINPTIAQLSVYPNPVISNATLEYTITKTESIAISIYDISGKCVKTIMSDFQSVGTHDLLFSRDALQKGLYLIKLETPTYAKTVRFMVN